MNPEKELAQRRMYVCVLTAMAGSCFKTIGFSIRAYFVLHDNENYVSCLYQHLQ